MGVGEAGLQKVRPKSLSGSRQTQWTWLAPSWVRSYATSMLGP